MAFRGCTFTEHRMSFKTGERKEKAFESLKLHFIRSSGAMFFLRKKVGLYSKKDVMVLFIYLFFFEKESFCTLPFDDRILDAFGISA